MCAPGLRILNGRTLGDSLGQPTFHGKNGISTIDYIICNQNLLHNIKHLIVKPPNYLSDHSQVVAWFDLQPVSNPKTNIDSTCTEQPKLEQLPSQYTWDKDSKAAFTQELKSNKIQNKLNNFLNNDFSDEKDGMNQCINEFQNIILEASKKSLKIRKTKRRSKINNVANKKWFDKDCRLKRHHLRKLANQKHRNPTNTEIRNEYHTALKDYKNTLQIKKNKFHQDKIEQLENATNGSYTILENS